MSVRCSLCLSHSLLTGFVNRKHFIKMDLRGSCKKRKLSETMTRVSVQLTACLYFTCQFAFSHFTSGQKTLLYNRYATGRPSKFIISETEEVTCTCAGRYGEKTTKATYYRAFFGGQEKHTFGRGTQRIPDVCGHGDLVFWRYYHRNREITIKANCYTYHSTHDKFPAIEVIVDAEDWKEKDGYFGFDGQSRASFTPCIREECPGKVTIYNIILRKCCGPGIPLPNLTPSSKDVHKTGTSSENQIERCVLVMLIFFCLGLVRYILL